MINNWQRGGCQVHAELPVLLHHGPNRHRGAAFRSQADGQHLVVTSYGTMHRTGTCSAPYPGGRPSWMRSRTSRTRRPSRPDRPGTPGRLPDSPHRHAGGEPCRRPLVHHAVPEPRPPGFPSRVQAHYFQPIQTDRDGAAAARLQKATGPFILRRLKTDRSIIDDLPDKNETKQYCNLTKEQATLYQAVLREAETRLESAEGMKRRGSILET